MPTTNCLLVANHVSDLATSLIAQLLGANYQVIMLVEDSNAPAYANPLPGLHLYQVPLLDRQSVEEQMKHLHVTHGDLQHLIFCSSAERKHVTGKDMERGRFWTTCFSHYHEWGSSSGSMVLLHKGVNQHSTQTRMNLLPGLSRWWAKQWRTTGLRCNSLCLRGYNNSQLHVQTGDVIKRLLQQQDNGCHYQLSKGVVSMRRSPMAISNADRCLSLL